MADVPGYAPLPNFAGQFEEGAQAGTAAGTALVQNALAGVQARNQTAQVQAQIPLVQAQTLEAQQNAAMTRFRMQAMQSQMGMAQSLLDATNKPPVNDALPGTQLSGTDAESGEVTSGPGVTSGPPSGAPSTGFTGSAGQGAAQANNVGASPAAASLTGSTTPFKGSGPGGTLTFDDVGLDPRHVAQSVKSQYGESGAMTTQEMQQWQQAQFVDARGAAMGMPSNYAGVLHDRYLNRVDQSVKDKAYRASSQYDALNQNVIGAPPGTALMALRGIGDGGQQMADKLQAMADKDGWTPQHLDQITRDITTDTARELWRYSGRKSVVGDDNVLRDEQNGEPVAGAPVRGPGVNATVAASARVAGALSDTVTVQNGTAGAVQMPRWQVPFAGHPNGYGSLEAAQKAAGIPGELMQGNQFTVDANGNAHPAPTGGYYSQPVTDQNGVPTPQPPRPARSPRNYMPPAAAPGAAPSAPAVPGAAPGATSAAAPGAAPTAGAPGPASAAPNGGAPSTGAPALNPFQLVQQRNALTQPSAPAQPVMGQPPPMGAPPAQHQAYDAKALADTTYTIPNPPNTLGVGMSANQKATQDALAAVRNEKSKELDEDVQGASQAQQFVEAAQDLMRRKGVPTGAYGGLIAQASKWLPGQSVDATSYQELAKYLGNAALQNARQTYGARMTQSEVKLQLGELSPSPSMTPQSINSLLGRMHNINQYIEDAGPRGAAYLNSPNTNPSQMWNWYQRWYPREGLVNGPIRVQSAADARALPGHTAFMTPDGRTLYTPATQGQ